MFKAISISSPYWQLSECCSTDVLKTYKKDLKIQPKIVNGSHFSVLSVRKPHQCKSLCSHSKLKFPSSGYNLVMSQVSPHHSLTASWLEGISNPLFWFLLSIHNSVPFFCLPTDFSAPNHIINTTMLILLIYRLSSLPVSLFLKFYESRYLMTAVFLLCVLWLCYPVFNKVFIWADAFAIPFANMDCLLCFNFVVDQKLWMLPQWDHCFT